MKVKVMQKYHNQALNYKLALYSFHLCIFNSSLPPMDSTNSNVHFRFDVVINGADTWKLATNETRASCAMDDHVERSVLSVKHVKTKTVRIKSLFFFQVSKSTPRLKFKRFLDDALQLIMLLTLLSSVQLKHVIFDGKFTIEFDLAVIILPVLPIIGEDLQQQTSDENISFW